MSKNALVIASSLLFAASAALATTPSTDYRERIKVAQTIQPLGERPFGEEINLYKGGLSFRQQDIQIPGNGPTITLSRSYSLGGGTASAPGKYPMGDWSLSIPRIQTIVRMYASGWTVAGQTDGTTRCTRFGKMSPGDWFAQSWWFGYTLVTPDGQETPLLRRTSENTWAQTGVTANIVTGSQWLVSCLPTTSNGMPGEAFLATAPDGTRYWFDALVYGPSVPALDYEVQGTRTILRRQLAYMYATRIEDRFGNWVSYQYTSGRPTEILASDGRHVTIAWRTDIPVIDSITVQPGDSAARTWRYEYVAGPQLSRVVLPDQSAWTLGMGSPYGYDLTFYEEDMSMCGARLGSAPQAAGTITITHPSGLTGQFDVSRVYFARAAVPTYCSGEVPSTERIPPVYLAISLVKKTISGPGVPSQSWQYAYGPAVGSSATECGSTPCNDQAWVEVTAPDGDITRYTHSTRWGASEGKLLNVISGLTTGGQADPVGLQKVSYEYAPSNAGPYPSRIGDNLDLFGGINNNDTIEYLMPQSKVTTTRQGRVFTWGVDANCGATQTSLCFDVFARPTKVTKSSTPSP